MRLFAILALTCVVAGNGAPTAWPENSLYQLESRWQRDDGKSLRLAELGGKVRVLSMFFSHCKEVCPMLMGQLKLLEQEIPAELWKDMGLVLVTLDPESDSTAALAGYRKEVHLGSERWTLLQGGPDDTRELANLIGVQYAPKQKDGQIEHTGLIVLLDSQGRVLEKFSGIEDRAAFVKRIWNATRTKP